MFLFTWIKIHSNQYYYQGGNENLKCIFNPCIPDIYEWIWTPRSWLNLQKAPSNSPARATCFLRTLPRHYYRVYRAIYVTYAFTQFTTAKPADNTYSSCVISLLLSDINKKSINNMSSSKKSSFGINCWWNFNYINHIVVKNCSHVSFRWILRSL